jgi:hypothetical protein
VPDAAASLRRRVLVAGDVALRIDDRRDSAALVGDEAGGVGEAVEVVLLDDHDRGCGTIRM